MAPLSAKATSAAFVGVAVMKSLRSFNVNSFAKHSISSQLSKLISQADKHSSSPFRPPSSMEQLVLYSDSVVNTSVVGITEVVSVNQKKKKRNFLKMRTNVKSIRKKMARNYNKRKIYPNFWKEVIPFDYVWVERSIDSTFQYLSTHTNS